MREELSDAISSSFPPEIATVLIAAMPVLELRGAIPVAIGAFEGVRKGIASAVESVGDKTKAFVREDLARTKEDLEAIEILFIEATRKVAQRSGDVAKDVLNDLADKTKKTTKTTTEAVSKAAHIMAEEAKELGKRSVAVAKGAISGMWKGAKEAVKKEKKK